ncbi:hypothetical protein RMATCC62417_04009 [Rhizopus microsporus]|nr:hypothetical protein RMATCC62417_04009 [Rhizopus microsporus]
METTVNQPWCSPQHKPITTVLPDSPEDIERYAMHSDDLQPTSDLHSSTLQSVSAKIVVVGDYQKPITLGRGGASTIKIGRRNRQISRIHVSIEYNNESQHFQLTVLGLNGANVDHIRYGQHAIVVLEDHSFIDVLGDHIEFRIPPPPRDEKSEELFNKECVEEEKPGEEEFKEEKADDLSIESIEEAAKDEKTNDLSQVEEKENESQEQDYSEVIIDALVFSRTSSMPISDICSRIMKSNPVYAEQSRELWIERIKKVLKEKPFFGEIQRKGKTADGSPKENLYYYNSELDPVEWRRATYTQVGRSARKCTLKDKQYFWKIPPKLGRHRSSYIPPPAQSEAKSKRVRQNEQNENNEPKKTKL